MAERRAADPVAPEPARWRLVTGVLARAGARIADCARDLARGVSGAHAYEQYVAHCRKHHPDRPIPSREEFFRREFTEKWEGIRRCC